MRIGIGVTSYNRPECLQKWKQQIGKHTKIDNVYVKVAMDSDFDRRGVAYRKNECLIALQDCDHIFLFDDDCYPIKDNWIDNFINSGYSHLLYLNDFHRLISHDNNVAWYRDCGGVFMYYRRECIDMVGAFNEKFDTWGFEHAEHTNRIYMAGLSPYNYMSLLNTSEFICSEDYSNPEHYSSISDDEKRKYFYSNFPKYKEKINNIYIPL